MQKLAITKLQGIGLVLIRTSKTVKELNNDILSFNDGSFVNSETGEFKFIGDNTDYLLEPITEEQAMEYIQPKKNKYNFAKLPQLYIFKMDAPINMTFS